MRAQLLLHRLAVQPPLRGRGDDVGDLGVQRVEPGAGLVAHRRVVRGQAARVVDERRDVVGPQALEPGRRVRAAQRPDLLGERLGVLPDRRVRGLREVLVVAQPAAHQVTGLDRVLAEQRLQAQRPVRPGLGRRRLRGSSGRRRRRCRRCSGGPCRRPAPTAPAPTALSPSTRPAPPDTPAGRRPPRAGAPTTSRTSCRTPSRADDPPAVAGPHREHNRVIQNTRRSQLFGQRCESCDVRSGIAPARGGRAPSGGPRRDRRRSRSARACGPQHRQREVLLSPPAPWTLDRLVDHPLGGRRGGDLDRRDLGARRPCRRRCPSARRS